MKKVLSFVLAALLILSCVIVVSAENEPTATLTASAKSIKAGETFDVTVSIANAPATKLFGINVAAESLDAFNANFEILEDSISYTGPAGMMSGYDASKKGYVSMASANSDYNGEIFTLTIKAKEDILEGKYEIPFYVRLGASSSKVDVIDENVSVEIEIAGASVAATPATVIAGENFDVTLSVADLKDIKSVGITINDSADFGYAAHKTKVSALIDNYSEERKAIAIAYGEPTNINGEFITITFSSNEALEAGEYDLPIGFKAMNGENTLIDVEVIAKVTVEAKPASKITYTADEDIVIGGDIAKLTDGVYADDATTFGDARLMNFNWDAKFNYGEPTTNGSRSMSIFVDLGEVKKVTGVKIGAYKERNSFVDLPEVTLWLSEDGVTYAPASSAAWTSGVEGLVDDTARDGSALKGGATYFSDWNTRSAFLAQYVRIDLVLNDPFVFLSEIEVIDDENETVVHSVSEVSFTNEVNGEILNGQVNIVNADAGDISLDKDATGIYKLARAGAITKAVWNDEANGYVVVYSQQNPWPNDRSGLLDKLGSGEIYLFSVSSGTKVDVGAGDKWAMKSLLPGCVLRVYDGIITINKELDGGTSRKVHAIEKIKGEIPEDGNIAKVGTYTYDSIKPGSTYSDNGSQLNDGIYAEAAWYANEEWVGLNVGKDKSASITFDFGAFYNIDKVYINCAPAVPGDGTCVPSSFTVAVSDDGETFASLDLAGMFVEIDDIHKTYKLSLGSNVEARYLRIAYHHGEKNWSFFDEIEVYAYGYDNPNVKEVVKVQPDFKLPLPEGAFILDFAGYKHAAAFSIVAGNNQTIAEITARGNDGKEKDMNYAFNILVDNFGVVIDTDFELGVPCDFVCPENGYIITFNGNKDGYADLASIEVGDIIMLYNVNTRAVAELEGTVELVDAGFTVIKKQPPEESSEEPSDEPLDKTDYDLLANAVNFAIDQPVSGEDIRLLTTDETIASCNTNWSINVLLKLNDNGRFDVISATPGTGSAWAGTLGLGEVLLAVHSDGVGQNNPSKLIAMALEEGDTITFKVEDGEVVGIIVNCTDPIVDTSKNLAKDAIITTEFPGIAYQTSKDILKDGVIGTAEYDSSVWFNVCQKNGDPTGEVVFDLGSVKDIKAARIHVWGENASGIDKIGNIEVFVSEDAENWTKIGEGAPDTTEPTWVEIAGEASGRYVKVLFTKGSSGAFVFVSEIEILEADAQEEPSSEEPSSEEPSSEEPSVEPSSEESNPQTPDDGDAGLIALGIISVITLAGVVVIKKSR